jgi:predicted NBD/HSP70 family sugar kinase
MALGELWFGAARRKSNALCLNIGWGLGLGVILDGRIVYGRDGFAGEFGHIEVSPAGRACFCGHTGCLETVASGRAISAIARERLQRGEGSRLTERVGTQIDAINTQMVVELARGGDALCAEVLQQAGEALGEGIAMLVNLFNPEVVVLGGRVAGAGDIILEPARAAALRHSMLRLQHNVDFVTSPLGARAGSLGVAMLAARDVFEVEHLNPSAYV